MNLCPCGKDVTKLQYQYHKYRCPKMNQKAGVERKAADAARSKRPTRPRSSVRSDKPLLGSVSKVSTSSQLEQTTSDCQSYQSCESMTTASYTESQPKQFPANGKSKVQKGTYLDPKAEHSEIAAVEPVHNEPTAKDAVLRQRISKVSPKRSDSPSPMQPGLKQNTTTVQGRSQKKTALWTSSWSWTNMLWTYLGWSDVEVKDEKVELYDFLKKEEVDTATTDTSSKRTPPPTAWKRFWKFFWLSDDDEKVKSSEPRSNTDGVSGKKNERSIWGKIIGLFSWIKGKGASKPEMIKPDNSNTEKCDVKKQRFRTKPTSSACRPKQVQQRNTKEEKDTSKTNSRNTKEQRIIDTKELDDIVERMCAEGVIKRSKNPKNDVKVFFDKEVKLSQGEITTVRERIKMLSEKIMGRLNLETNLGGWDFRNAGSSSDGTKVSRLNEMDCIMFPRVSKHMKAVFDESCVPGFCKVKVMGGVEDTDVGLFSDGKFLNSRKFRDYVFKKLESIVEGDRKLKDARKFPETLSFAIEYTAIPTETGMLSVDVDFVPSIHISAWPQPQYARDITKVLDDSTKAKGIRNQGFNATPKHCTSGSKETKDLLWQVSFSYAEKQITKYGDKKCWKPTMRTLKRILEIAKGDVDSSSGNNQLSQIQKAAEYAKRNFSALNSLRLTTYHIRTLMWTLRYDVTIGGHVWTEDTQANRLRSTLRHFQKMMTGEVIVPHFFIPDVRNIMDGISVRERKYLYIVAKATEIIFSN